MVVDRGNSVIPGGKVHTWDNGFLIYLFKITQDNEKDGFTLEELVYVLGHSAFPLSGSLLKNLQGCRLYIISGHCSVTFQGSVYFFLCIV